MKNTSLFSKMSMAKKKPCDIGIKTVSSFC